MSAPTYGPHAEPHLRLPGQEGMGPVTRRRRTVGSRPSDSQPDRRFEAVVFDWDGTAVPDRRADATAVRVVVEGLSGLGMDVAVVSGTHVANIDGQLRARPSGPRCLPRATRWWPEPRWPAGIT